jgi:hypothetical protein
MCSFLYFKTCILEGKLEDRRSWTECEQAFAKLQIIVKFVFLV